MGMITRIRGRLRGSVHTIPKLNKKLRDEKIAETVSLLSVLFLLPYCSRGHAPLLLSLGGWCLATYSFLVLPLLISANYKYPTRWLRNAICSIPENASFLLQRAKSVIWECNHHLEELFDNGTYKHLHLLVSQMIFFALCDYALIPNDNTPDPKNRKVVCALTNLLLYTIVTYFCTKIENIINDNSSGVVNMLIDTKSIWINVAKVLIEFLKATMIVICLHEQGLNYYYEFAYTWTTAIYYVCTEDFYVDIAVMCTTTSSSSTRSGNWRIEEEFAKLYLYIGTGALSICMALFLLCACYDQISYASAILVIIIIVVLPIAKTKHLYVNTLREYCAFVRTFPVVNKQLLVRWDDVCPVCLDDMHTIERPRVTPCQHIFHVDCLIRSLEVTRMCPLCKCKFEANKSP